MLSRMIALAHAAVLVAAVLTTSVIAPAEAAPPTGRTAAQPETAPTAAPPAPSPARSRPAPAAAPAPRAARPAVLAAPVRRRVAPAPVAPAPSPSRRVRSARLARAAVSAPRPAEPTAQQRLDRAVRRIPGYRAHPAAWELTDRFGSWGTADWHSDRIYVSPRVPRRRLFDVVVHEWSHLRSVDAYGGDVQTAVAEMNRWFGGTGLRGAELAADCMARQLGATWTGYTACTSEHDRAGAAALLQGRPLA